MEKIAREDFKNRLLEMKFYNGIAYLSIHFITDNPNYSPNDFSQELYDSETDYSMEYLRKKEDGSDYYHFEFMHYYDDDGNVMPKNSKEWLNNFSKICEYTTKTKLIQNPTPYKHIDHERFIMTNELVDAIMAAFDWCENEYGNVYDVSI